MFLSELQRELDEVDVVLLDRYVFSNLAYQGAKYPTGTIASDRIKKWIMDFEFKFLKLPYPDLNIFFDVPIEVTKKRLEEKREGNDRDYLQGKQDIHEADFEFQERVRQNYLGVMEKSPNCKIINCTIELKDEKSRLLFVLAPEDIFKTEVKPALKMTKPRSPLTILFTIEDVKDDWLINVISFRTKSGEITHDCMIIKPDIDSHAGLYEKDGFTRSLTID
jgi:thymidylate kinase